MKSYQISSYEEVGPSSTFNNYFVRSDLGQGEAKIHSQGISTKMLLTGSEVYESMGNRYAIRNDQFLLTAPDESFELTVKSAAVGCCFYFDLNYVERLMSELISEDLEGGDDTTPNFQTLRLPTRNSALGLNMQAVAKNLIDPNANILATLLAETIVNASYLSAKLPCKREKTRRELLSRLEAARAFILDAKNTQISLQDIERASCLSRFHLNRSFALAYGTPPLRFHQNLRLDIARGRIKAGAPLSDISEELGFSTVSSFARAYRRRHNTSPKKAP